MKVHSLKLTIQDIPDKEGNLFAAVFGTVILDTGEVAKNKDGTDKLDEEGQKIPILEDIQTIVPLNANPDFRRHIQAFLVEAITLKNYKIAEKNGQLSHFIEAVGANPEEGKHFAVAPKKKTDDKKKTTKSKKNKKST